jgi:hypothetical protein
MKEVNDICVSISPNVQRERNSRLAKAMVQISMYHRFILVILIRPDTSGLGSTNEDQVQTLGFASPPGRNTFSDKSQVTACHDGTRAIIKIIKPYVGII